MDQSLDRTRSSTATGWFFQPGGIPIIHYSILWFLDYSSFRYLRSPLFDVSRICIAMTYSDNMQSHCMKLFYLGKGSLRLNWFFLPWERWKFAEKGFCFLQSCKGWCELRSLNNISGEFLYFYEDFNKVSKDYSKRNWFVWFTCEAKTDT